MYSTFNAQLIFDKTKDFYQLFAKINKTHTGNSEYYVSTVLSAYSLRSNPLLQQLRLLHPDTTGPVNKFSDQRIKVYAPHIFVKIGIYFNVRTKIRKVKTLNFT
jgi:hypothetical protein